MLETDALFIGHCNAREALAICSGGHNRYEYDCKVGERLRIQVICSTANDSTTRHTERNLRKPMKSLFGAKAK